MGMSTHAAGFKPPDDKWIKMKQAYDACVGAGVDVPDEVDEFFNGEAPDDEGVEVDLEEHPCCQKWEDGSREGFQIDLTKLPKDLRFIRVYNSW